MALILCLLLIVGGTAGCAAIKNTVVRDTTLQTRSFLAQAGSSETSSPGV